MKSEIFFFLLNLKTSLNHIYKMNNIHFLSLVDFFYLFILTLKKNFNFIL